MTKENPLRNLKFVNPSPNTQPKPREFSKAEPALDIKLAPRNMPLMRELIRTENEIKNADRDDIYSLAVIMKACRKWKAFSEVSTEKEDEDALPYFRRFVREMKSYISDSPKERAIPAMHDLAELMPINISSVSYALTEIYGDTREEIRKTAFAHLERNSFRFINAANFFERKQYSMLDQISTILETYAEEAYTSPETAIIDHMNGDSRHPHPPNEKIATSISTFLFFQKEGLIRSSEGIDLLPYAISWASEHYDTDKIDFMIDRISDLPRGFRKEILLKVVIFANSEPIRLCALDLLLDMGVHTVKSEEELGGMEDLALVNRLLRDTFEQSYSGFADNIVMLPSSALH